MQEHYYNQKVDLAELCKPELNDFLQEKRERGMKVCIVMELNNTFDEWDIEKYVEALRALRPEKIRIVLSEQMCDKPTLHQLREVQGALEHFATFERYCKKSKRQFYYTGETEIIFESQPV